MEVNPDETEAMDNKVSASKTYGVRNILLEHRRDVRSVSGGLHRIRIRSQGVRKEAMVTYESLSVMSQKCSNFTIQSGCGSLSSTIFELSFVGISRF